MLEEGKGESQYTFQAANDAPDETVRLDELHEGIKEYFNNRLSLAPLEDMQPEKILEMGSGSGAWAIQAAMIFPNATVLAVDLSPIPKRTIPPNLTFQKIDLTLPFPFSNETFDIVHARLVMMHLPKGEDVLRRTCDLVKPGGWLLVEDPDDENMRDDGKLIGPGMRAFLDAWLNLLRYRGAEPTIGRSLERLLVEAGRFSEVHSKKVTIPISGHGTDTAENRLGKTWMTVSKRVAHDLPARFTSIGISQELVQKHLEELEDPARRITTDMYFTWSRRK